MGMLYFHAFNNELPQHHSHNLLRKGDILIQAWLAPVQKESPPLAEKEEKSSRMQHGLELGQ